MSGHSWRSVCFEDCATGPSPMEYDGDTARQGDHRNFSATALRELCSPFLNQLDRPRFIITVAAWHNACLKLTSPALVMPPETSRSPDWLREGVRPTQGPIIFDDLKRVGSSTAARNDNATTAPIRGIVIRRRQTGASCASWRTRFSRLASSCRKEALARSIGPVAVSSMGFPSANSRMRASNLPREIAPTLRPKFRNSPLSDIFRAIMFC